MPARCFVAGSRQRTPSNNEEYENEEMGDGIVPAWCCHRDASHQRRCTAGARRRGRRDHRWSRWRPARRSSRRGRRRCRRGQSATSSLAQLLLAPWTVLVSLPEREISSGGTSLLPLTTGHAKDQVRRSETCPRKNVRRAGFVNAQGVCRADALRFLSRPRAARPPEVDRL